MGIIAIIPGLIAFHMASSRSPERAFVAVYLPTLLLIPEYYRFIAPGIPDPNFSQSAILALFAVFVMRGRHQTWRWSVGDGLVIAYAVSVAWSQFLATGYSDAQNLAFDMIGFAVLPYAAAKAFIEPKGRRQEVAVRVVLLLAFVAFVSLYEFKMGRDPFRDLLRPFFPSMGWGWITNIRWGFARVAGPFGHAILAGVMFAAGFRLQRWLQQSGYWGKSWKGPAVTATLLMGMGMTMSRGPWIGAFLGAVVHYVGTAKKRGKIIGVAIALGIVLGVPALAAFNAYVSVGREGATNATQETAAYRKELMEKYWDIVIEHMWFGWGLNTWPKVPGMPSIDNHYLLISLMHGLVTLGLFLTIILRSMTLLGMRGMSLPPQHPEGRFAFVLLSMYLMIGFSIATVYLGLQTIQLFFIVTGWAEGFLARRAPATASQPAGATPIPQPRFRRVLT